MKWEFNRELTKEQFKNYEELTLSYLMFANEEITDLDIHFETFREVLFKKCKFINVTFDNSFLGKVKFQNCEFTNVTWNECNLNNVFFDNCKLINISIFASTLSNIEILESLLEYSKIENTNLANSLFNDVKLFENIHRHNKYEYIKFDRCQFISDNFIDTNFKECNLKTSHFENIKINLDELITSTLSMLSLLEIVSSKGIIIED